MSRITDLRFRKIVRPLRTTFATSLGQKQQMTSILVTVVLDDGNSGTGEVPTSFAFPQETVEAISRTLTEARRDIVRLDINDWEGWVSGFRKRFQPLRMTVSGLEVALLRARLSAQGITEHVYWGSSRSSLETDITIPLADDQSIIGRWIDRAAAEGFTAYKLKLGGCRVFDESLLSSVHAALHDAIPGFRLRLDGNQGYSTSGFLSFLEHIQEKGYAVEFFEQPLAKGDIKGYEEIMKKRSIPIFLDESVCSMTDAARAIDNGLCDGINIKIAKTGPRESAAILDLARRAGKRCMIGCMIETMVGLSAAISFAAGTDGFDIVDLDSTQFLYGSNDYAGIEVSGPVIRVVQNS